jgi:hypothetical protein
MCSQSQPESIIRLHSAARLDRSLWRHQLFSHPRPARLILRFGSHSEFDEAEAYR